MGAHLSLRPPQTNTSSSSGGGGARSRNYSTADSPAADLGATSDGRRAHGSAVRSRSRSLDIFNTSSGSFPSDSDWETEEEEAAAAAAASAANVGAEQLRQRCRHAAEHGRRRHQHHQVPLSFYRSDIKCPVCNKMIPHEEIELHLIQCLTKPRINYNEDVLVEDKGECTICFEELCQGDTIARLPCLCVYHKGCIDEWFKRSRSCPQHPGEE